MSDKPLTSDSIREIALALPSCVESPHFDRTSFRVNKKIFATLSSDKEECVLKLSVADREALLALGLDSLYDVGWANQGWIGVAYTKLHPDTLQEFIETAWKNVAPRKLVTQFECDQ